MLVFISYFEILLLKSLLLEAMHLLRIFQKTQLRKLGLKRVMVVLLCLPELGAVVEVLTKVTDDLAKGALEAAEVQLHSFM